MRSLSRAVLEDPRDGSTEEIAVTGAFAALWSYQLQGFLEGQLETDDEGYLIHKEHTMTSIAAYSLRVMLLTPDTSKQSQQQD